MALNSFIYFTSRKAPTFDPSSNFYDKIRSMLSRSLHLIQYYYLLPCQYLSPQLNSHHCTFILIQATLRYSQLCSHKYKQHSSSTLSDRRFHHHLVSIIFQVAKDIQCDDFHYFRQIVLVWFFLITYSPHILNENYPTTISL